MVYVPGVTRFAGTPASCQVNAPAASAVSVTLDAPATEYTADAGVVPAGGAGRSLTVPAAVPLNIGLRTSRKTAGGTGGAVSVGELTKKQSPPGGQSTYAVAVAQPGSVACRM